MQKDLRWQHGYDMTWFWQSFDHARFDSTLWQLEKRRGSVLECLTWDRGVGVWASRDWALCYQGTKNPLVPWLFWVKSRKEEGFYPKHSSSRMSALGRIILPYIQYCMHAFARRVKIVSHSSCRTSAVLKYFCPLVMSFLLCLVLVKPRKTHPDLTENLSTWIKESNQTNKRKHDKDMTS